MNKTVRYILYGVGTCVAVFLIMIFVRSWIREVPVADGIKDWTNWLIAVLCGVSTAYSSRKKDQEKKDK